MMREAVTVINMTAQFRWAVLQPPESGIRLMMHIPHGGYRKPSEAARFQMLGVQAVVDRDKAAAWRSYERRTGRID